MATGMKIWLGSVVGGLLLVSAWLLPPEPAVVRARQTIPPERQRARALSAELKARHTQLRSMRWASSLEPLLADAAPGDVLVTAPPGALSPETMDAVRAALEAEALDDVRAETAGAVLLYAYRDPDDGLAPGVSVGRSGRTETHVGRFGDTPYCVRIRSSTYMEEAAQLDLTLLDGEGARYRLAYQRWGVCEWYAAYGAPGEHVLRWLERGGVTAAIGDPDHRTAFTSTFVGRRVWFGIDGYGASGSIFDRCLAGIAETCSEMLLFSEDRWWLGSPPALALQDMTGPLGSESAFLLHDVEKAFGPEAFSRFWTSSAPLEEAFEDAFEIELGDWLVQWVDGIHGIDPAGPRLARHNVLGSLLLLSMLGGLATFRARKRRLG